MKENILKYLLDRFFECETSHTFFPTYKNIASSTSVKRIDSVNEFIRMIFSAMLKWIGIKIKIKKDVIQRLYIIHLNYIELHILYYFLVR